MAKIVITKEELQHDEVLESTDRFLHWLKANRTAILAAILAAFAIYATVLLLQGRRTKILMEGNNLLVEAERAYGQAVMEHAWASPERVAAMQKVSDKADEILAAYKDTPVARQALMLKGNAWYNAGDSLADAAAGGAKNTQRAMEVFEEYVATAEPNTFDAAAGNLALGYAYENAYFLNRASGTLVTDALRNYKAAEDNPNAGFLGQEAKLARARILSFTGKADEAEKLYREVLEAGYQPLTPPDDASNQIAGALHFIRQQREQFTMAGTARANLQRMGVDVNTEFPLVKQPEAEATP